MARALQGRARCVAAAALVAALVQPAAAQLVSIGPELLSPSEAFVVTADLDQGRLGFNVAIADDYYLYRSRIFVKPVAGGATVGELSLPAGEVQVDEFFGEMETFRGDLAFSAPVMVPAGAGGDQLFELSLQGCADAGVCYAPYVTRFSFRLGGGAGVLVPVDGPVGFGQVSPPVDNTNVTVVALEGGSLPLILFLFFNAGLFLALTPCVLPMVPIAVAVTTGGSRPGGARALSLGAVYVAGMAVVYTLIGVLVARSGSTILAGSLQQPLVLIPLALAFLALSAAMFFELNMGLLPHGLSSRIAALRWRQGTYPGALLAGGVSAVVVSPCVAVPLVGALLYIATTGDVLLGAGALFALSLGMGMLPLACAAGAGRFLPRTGPLSEAVRRFFALLLAALAVWVLGPLAPPAAKMVAYGILAAVGAVIFARAVLHDEAGAPAHVAGGVACMSLSVLAVVMLAGGLTGGTNELRPLAHLSDGEELVFEVVATEAQYKKVVGDPQNQASFEYYYADWCVSCRELEGYTFKDPGVVAALAGRKIIKVDLTADDGESRRLLAKANLFGPPGIIMRDAGGLQQLRYVGYVDGESLLAAISGLPDNSS